MNLMDKLKGGVDAAMMKKIAIVTMFIDHLTLTCLEVSRDQNRTRIMYTFQAGEILDEIGRGIGRLAFPVFCFLIVEGFIHTRNRLKYLIRLLIFAAIAHVPFNLMAFPYTSTRHTDTIFTLAAGFAVIWGITYLSRLLPEKYRPVPWALRKNEIEGDIMEDVEADPIAAPAPEDPWLIKLPASLDNLVVRAILFVVPSAILTYGICRLAKWAGCDYSYGGVLCILILFLFYRVRDFSLLAAWLWLTYYNHAEILAFTGFYLIRCYNGKRGKQNKYFFYVFYPLHLYLLYLLRVKVWGY